MSDSTCHVEAARDCKQENWSIKRLCLSFGVCESLLLHFGVQCTALLTTVMSVINFTLCSGEENFSKSDCR